MKNYLNTLSNYFKKEKADNKYDFIYRFSLDDDEFMDIRFCDLPYNDFESKEKLYEIMECLDLLYCVQTNSFRLIFNNPNKDLTQYLFKPIITFGRYIEKGREEPPFLKDGDEYLSMDKNGHVYRNEYFFDPDNYTPHFIRDMSTKSVEISENDFKNNIKNYIDFNNNLDQIEMYESEDFNFASLMLVDKNFTESTTKIDDSVIPYKFVSLSF